MPRLELAKQEYEKFQNDVKHDDLTDASIENFIMRYVVEDTELIMMGRQRLTVFGIWKHSYTDSQLSTVQWLAKQWNHRLGFEFFRV
jgi:hypothetical protein